MKSIEVSNNFTQVLFEGSLTILKIFDKKTSKSSFIQEKISCHINFFAKKFKQHLRILRITSFKKTFKTARCNFQFQRCRTKNLRIKLLDYPDFETCSNNFKILRTTNFNRSENTHNPKQRKKDLQEENIRANEWKRSFDPNLESVIST